MESRGLRRSILIILGIPAVTEGQFNGTLLPKMKPILRLQASLGLPALIPNGVQQIRFHSSA